MSKKKCPICGAEMKIDTSAVCTSIPPKYRCVCPSCNYLDFIKTSEYDQYKEEPSLPSNLDEAAEENSKNYYCSNLETHNETGICDGCENVKLAFKAGAEWRDGAIEREFRRQILEELEKIENPEYAGPNGVEKAACIWQLGHIKLTEVRDMAAAFAAGAEWMAGQGSSREVEVKEDAGGYPYIDIHIELYDYDTDAPLAKKGDKVVVQIRNK